MAQKMQVCDINPELKEKFKKFKLRKEKNIAAIVMKIKDDVVEEEEEHEDISIDDLREELPERHQRFVLLSYVHKMDDSRVSYPLCFIFLNPRGCKMETTMRYTGSKKAVVEAAKATKVFDLDDLEDFTDEFLKQKLRS